MTIVDIATIIALSMVGGFILTLCEIYLPRIFLWILYKLNLLSRDLYEILLSEWEAEINDQ